MRLRALNSLAICVFVIAVFSLTANHAHAQRKAKLPKPACGITAIPFIQGSEWIYKPGVVPNLPKGPIAKPKQPESVTIKVVSVAPLDKKITEITLEEKTDDVVITTKLTCEKDKLTVPITSFFFAGEPAGGATNIELSDVERTGVSYVFRKGKLGDLYGSFEWSENIKAKFSRVPTEGTSANLTDGTMDLQRNITVGGQIEAIKNVLATDEDGLLRTIAMQVDLRGSITLNLDPPKEFNIPANTIYKLWFANGIGLIQAYNTNIHMWELVERKLPEPEDPKKKKAGKK